MSAKMRHPLGFFLAVLAGPFVRTLAATPTSETPGLPRDGQHDFDFNLGTWKTHIRRLLHPLSGSDEWVELDGTVAVRKVWGGHAQLEEIEADGSTGHFYDQEDFQGRSILDRNGFSDIKPDSSRFEQAFSDDGGKNWETNWIMTFTR